MPAFGWNRLESYLTDDCCHVSLFRVTRCCDDLDQGDSHMFKNNVKFGSELVSVRAFDEILPLDPKEHRETGIPAWAWELSYRDHFRSWTTFCHFRTRTFLLRHGDKPTDPEVIAFVVRPPRGFFLHLERCLSVQIPSSAVFSRRPIGRSRLTGRMETARPRWLRLSSVLFNARPLRS